MADSGFKTLFKWMRDKMQSWEGDGASPAYGAVTQPTVLGVLKSMLKNEAKSQLLFRSPYVPVSPKDQTLHKAVYGVQCFVIPQGRCQAGPPAYG
eukprot:3455122-Pyramimonas_sp.AAC.1